MSNQQMWSLWQTYKVNQKTEFTAQEINDFIDLKRKELNGKEFYIRRLKKKEKLVYTQISGLGQAMIFAQEWLGISALFLMGQFCYETNVGFFTGDVEPKKHNPAGLKAFTSDPSQAASFKSWKRGFFEVALHLRKYLDPENWRYRQIKNSGLDPQTPQGIYHLWSTAGETHDIAVARYMDEFLRWREGKLRLTMPRIVIEMGHVGRTRGATGTPGEQAFTRQVGAWLREYLPEAEIVPADFGSRHCDLFLSLHADGSNNPEARGFSVGYPEGDNGEFAQFLAERYQKFTGFQRRKDNYTLSMRNYNAWRRVEAKYRCLLEAGFFTNRIERTWLTNNIKIIAEHLSETVREFLKGKQATSEIGANP